MNLISWNVNGIRAVAKKNFFDYFKSADADIFCIQETKAQDDQVTETLASIESYHLYSNSAERKGYSGTAVLCKNKPIEISYEIGMNQHDLEGRVIALDFDKFYLVNVYVPNSGNELGRLDYRQTWYLDFFNYLKRLENSKPVIVCGDFNVAYKDIDLASQNILPTIQDAWISDQIMGSDHCPVGIRLNL